MTWIQAHSKKANKGKAKTRWEKENRKGCERQEQYNNEQEKNKITKKRQNGAVFKDLKNESILTDSKQ